MLRKKRVVLVQNCESLSSKEGADRGGGQSVSLLGRFPPDSLRSPPPPSLGHRGLAGPRVAKQGSPASLPPGSRVPLPALLPPGPRAGRRRGPRSQRGTAPPTDRNAGEKRSLLQTFGPPLHPQKTPAASDTARQRPGAAARAGELTRRTRVSRDSRPAAGWASAPGTPAASCQPGRQRDGIAPPRQWCLSRCSWRRLRGCWSSGRRADRLCGSSGTTRFREWSSGGPPSPRLPGRAACGAPATRPSCYRCSSLERGVGNREAVGRAPRRATRRCVAGQPAPLNGETRKRTTRHTGPGGEAPTCSLLAANFTEVCVLSQGTDPEIETGGAGSARHGCPETPPRLRLSED